MFQRGQLVKVLVGDYKGLFGKVSSVRGQDEVAVQFLDGITKTYKPDQLEKVEQP